MGNKLAESSATYAFDSFSSKCFVCTGVCVQVCARAGSRAGYREENERMKGFKRLTKEAAQKV